MLDTEDLGIVEVEVVRGPAIGIEVLLVQLEADARGILVGARAIVDGPDVTARPGRLGRHGLAEIMGEGRYAAEPRGIIAEKGDPSRKD